MRRGPGVALVLAAVALALGGCAAKELERADTHSDNPQSDSSTRAVTTDSKNTNGETTPEALPGLGAEPAYPKLVVTPGEDRTSEDDGPRAVSLPDTVTVAPAAEPTAARALVAVAFVRGGKLVPRAQDLRALARALEHDGTVRGVVALARLDAQAPDPAKLPDLIRVAQGQGAQLLVIDARAADASALDLGLVVGLSRSAVLQCERSGSGGLAPDDRARELAALVRAVR